MLHIDGTDEQGNLDGSATRGPWAIFDDEAQTWRVTGIRWKWLARRTKRRLGMAGALLVASLAAWHPASACEAFGECTARAVMQEQQDRAQQARMDQLTQDNQRLQTEARDAELRSVLGIDPWSSPRR